MEILMIGFGLVAAWGIGATIRAVSRDGYGQIPTDLTRR
jgi:hypothetical protein